MTTIAYRDGIVAADSRGMVAGWVDQTTEVKISRCINGSVLAGTGDLAEVSALIRYFQEHGDDDAGRPRLTDSARVIWFENNGRIRVYEGAGWFYQGVAPFAAWGSGMPVALGAMHAGASAAEAVAIAALVDPNTGGEVISLEVNRPVLASVA